MCVKSVSNYKEPLNRGSNSNVTEERHGLIYANEQFLRILHKKRSSTKKQ